MPGTTLQLEEHDADGACTIALEGELDLQTAPDLCRRLVAHRGERLVVDLSALAFCDSSGLRALLGEARETQIQGGSLTIVAPPSCPVRRLLEMTGVVEALGVHPDRAHAVASV